MWIKNNGRGLKCQLMVTHWVQDMLVLGYTLTPPKETDSDGNKLQPGPYKIIQFFPPKGDGTTLLTGI